jgi:hypothetical protein
MDCSRDLLHYKSYLWIFPSKKIEIVSTVLTWEDSRRLQRAFHRSKPCVTNMWGWLAPPTGWSASGPHMLAPPCYVGSLPSQRSNLRCSFKSVWSEGPRCLKPPIYTSPQPPPKGNDPEFWNLETLIHISTRIRDSNQEKINPPS